MPAVYIDNSGDEQNRDAQNKNNCNKSLRKHGVSSMRERVIIDRMPLQEFDNNDDQVCRDLNNYSKNRRKKVINSQNNLINYRNFNKNSDLNLADNQPLKISKV